MRNMRIFPVILLAALIFAGCEKQISNKEEAPPPKTTMNAPDQTKSGETKKEVKVLYDKAIQDVTDEKILESKIQRMIIKTGTMNLEVDRFDDAEARLNESVKKFGGYVSNSSSSQNTGGKKSGTLTLKVPAEKFDVFIGEVSSFGKVLNQNIQSKDITEEYVDLEARLKTQKELEERLIKLLNDKASKLAEVIEVEEKLASVRQKIESIDAKMRILKSQSDLSTLTVSVYEPSMLETSSGGGFFYELWQAVKKGIKGFTNVLAASITILIAIIPIVIFVLIIIWLVRKIFFRKKAKTV